LKRGGVQGFNEAVVLSALDPGKQGLKHGIVLAHDGLVFRFQRLIQENKD